jgi:hypothetical protein
MPFLIVAMLLTIVQATPPAPRPSPNNSASGSQKVQSKAQAKQNTAAPSAPVKPSPSAAQDQDKTISPANADAQETVALHELPPVSVSKDKWDYVYIVFTGLLVLIGGFTLRAILYQAKKTADATTAMERNTAAFIESQRPILAVLPHENPFADLMDKHTPRVKLSLMNKGQTTAYECIYESWIEMLPLPPPVMDFSSKADYASVADRFSLPPNHEGRVINIPFTQGLSEADRLDLGHARRTAYVRLRVTFRDAFTPNRYAEFGFYVMFDGLGSLPKYQDSN